MWKTAPRRFLFLSLLFFIISSLTGCGDSLFLSGAGATFPYPLYSKWIAEYAKVEPRTKIDYQSIGSGAGVAQLLAGTVDFGASDTPMSDAELARSRKEVVHIPAALGAVVVVYNLPGLPSPLRLTPQALADIFLGRITRWDHPGLGEINPGLPLPARDLVVVYRSDGSGTTGVFTDYLSQVSPEWATRVGAGRAVSFPVGIGAKGNEGVTGQVKGLPYSLGYVELAYATQNNLPIALLRNREGRFQEPTVEAIEAAAATAPLPPDLRASIVDAPGENSYPLSAYTYLLVFRWQPDRAKGEALARFLWWAVYQGQGFNRALDYAPLPHPVVERVEEKLRSLTSQGQPLLPRP